MTLAVIEKVFSEEHEQRARELEAYRAALDCQARGDHVGARRQMKRFAELHSERPAEMVAKMEREKGLA